jgi:hypothetical protein
VDPTYFTHHSERIGHAAKRGLAKDSEHKNEPAISAGSVRVRHARGGILVGHPPETGLGGQTSQDAPTTVTTHVASPPFTVEEHTTELGAVKSRNSGPSNCSRRRAGCERNRPQKRYVTSTLRSRPHHSRFVSPSETTRRPALSPRSASARAARIPGRGGVRWKAGLGADRQRRCDSGRSRSLHSSGHRAWLLPALRGLPASRRAKSRPPTRRPGAKPFE